MTNDRESASVAHHTFEYARRNTTGFVVTAGVLTAGLVNFRRGGPPAVSSRMMRLRVVAQTLTMAAFIVGGGSFLQESNNDTTSIGEIKTEEKD